MANLYDTGKTLKQEHPEKFKILCQAMEQTHGKVDNPLTQLLLKSEQATTEDIVRLGGTYNDEKRSSWGSNTVFWHEPDNYGTKEERKERREKGRREKFNSCREFKFKDSFLYRAMVKMGMSPTEKDGDWYETQRTYTTNPTGGYGAHPGQELAQTKYAEVTVMYMRAGEDLRKAIMNSDTLSRLWTEQARVRREVDHIYNAEEAEKNPITSTNEEWRKFQSDHIIKEFGWLANMPENVKKDMDEFMDPEREDKRRGYWRREELPPTLTNTILGAFRYPSTDKNMELVREAYQVMEYIGIGVCWNYVERVKDDGTKEYREVYSNQKATGVGSMLKKVSSMMRRFTADMRKGFDPEDVRELIVEDLNGWAASKVGDRWQFYPRTDAKKEYEEFAKKKKPSMSKVKLYQKNASLEIDENNPEDAGFLAVMNKLEDNNNDIKATE